MLERHSQHVHLTMGGTHPPPCQKGPTLTSTEMIGHNIYHPRKGSALTSTGIAGHTIYYPEKCTSLISSGIAGHTIYYPRKGSTLIFNHARNQSSLHVERALHLHSTMQGTNPAYMLKGLCTYIRPCKEPIKPTCRKGSTLTFNHARNQSSLHVERALSPRLWIPGN